MVPLMLASVLNSPVAVQASIQVVRAFLRLRAFLATQHQLALKLLELEKRVGEHDDESGHLRRYPSVDAAAGPARPPHRLPRLKP